MEFQSGIFLAFFAALLAVYHNLPSRAKPWLLLAANAVFYAAGGVQWLPLLAAAVVISWAAALAMDRIAARPARLALLWGCVVLFVGQLFYFKYFSALLRGLFDYRLQIIAPLGVSFYSFTILGYIIDVYCRTQPAEKNLVRYAAFVSMFAQITSGPIERGSNMLPQLAAPRPYSFEQLAQGLSRALWGFYKKFVLANMLANMVGAVYGDVESFSGPFLLLASLLYSYQLYLDFGGYSDIAIGMMQALGYDVMENFRRPFAARSYTQLWDRWHISLTSWFRDYVFTPLTFSIRGVGGRAGKWLGWLSIFIIFPLSGVWHGTGFHFLAWGGLHGLAQIFDIKNWKLPRPVKQLLVFLFVDLTWMVFRVNSLGDLKGMLLILLTDFRLRDFAGMELTVFEWLLVLLGILLVLLKDVANERGFGFRRWILGQNAAARCLIYTGMIGAVVVLGVYGAAYDTSQFLYTQF